MSEQLDLGLPSANLTMYPQSLETDVLGERPIISEIPDFGDPKHWLWSLKAGGRNVWFKKIIQVYAFHLLSSDRNCKDIEERPFSESFPYEDIPWYRFVIGTRSYDGTECLWGIEVDSSLRPDGDGSLRPENWHLVQEWCRERGRQCSYIRESDIFAHRALIENWKKLMSGVRQAHDDPNESLRNEVCALAEHPEGISIEQIVYLVDERPKKTFNEICWLIHQNRLLTDLNGKPLSDQYVVRSTRTLQ